MNTPVRRLATVVLVMFLALMVSATWVQFVQAPTLNADQRNVRTLYNEYGNARGPIVVGGESVALSEPVDDVFGYQRLYPEPEVYAPVTGFYSVVFGRTGLEREANDQLTGRADSLFWTRLQDLLTGRRPQGSAVETTILPAAQEAAYEALDGLRGAVVALDPRTGAILAMVSTPSFDPNLLAGHDTAVVNEAYRALEADEDRPMVNRAIGGDTYPPGSTFKLVTAAAAIEAGLDPDDEVFAPRELDLPLTSATVQNYGGSACDSGDTTTLKNALRISCNTAFAQIGMDLGADALRRQAEAFGFGEALRVPMRVTPSTFPSDPDAPQTAISAIGQFEVRATPMQMAMVAAAIANDGVQMQPYLVERVRTADLAVVEEARPTELRRSVSPATAEALTEMMVEVVRSGSGTAAQIGGVEVAGKTGTAQHAEGEDPHAWFTAFAPADDPQVAVAVVVERGGSLGSEATGGRVAAPIARAVLQAVIDG